MLWGEEVMYHLSIYLPMYLGAAMVMLGGMLAAAKVLSGNTSPRVGDRVQACFIIAGACVLAGLILAGGHRLAELG
jgi:hypothetical protein